MRGDLAQSLLAAAEAARRVPYEVQGLPVPDGRKAYTWHAICPNCTEPLVLSVDVSCGPPSQAWTECDSCGAEVAAEVDWHYAVELGKVAVTRPPPVEQTD